MAAHQEELHLAEAVQAEAQAAEVTEELQAAARLEAVQLAQEAVRLTAVRLAAQAAEVHRAAVQAEARQAELRLRHTLLQEARNTLHPAA